MRVFTPGSASPPRSPSRRPEMCSSRWRMRRIGDLGDFRREHGFLAVIARVLSSGALFGGIFFMAMAFFSNLVGLSWADLSLMGPASAALTFVTNAMGAKFFLHENVDRRRWFATIFVCCRSGPAHPLLNPPIPATMAAPDGWPIFALCWQMWGCRPPPKAPELELRQLWATRRACEAPALYRTN